MLNKIKKNIEMSLVNKNFESNRISDEYLIKQLRIAAKSELRLLNQEKLQRLQKIGYVRPRSRLQLMYADDYMNDKQYANILGLEQVIKNNPELTDEQINRIIVRHKVTLVFLNHVLSVVPNAVNVIRIEGSNGVVYKYARTLEHKRDNRRKL